MIHADADGDGGDGFVGRIEWARDSWRCRHPTPRHPAAAPTRPGRSSPAGTCPMPRVAPDSDTVAHRRRDYTASHNIGPGSIGWYVVRSDKNGTARPKTVRQECPPSRSGHNWSMAWGGGAGVLAQFFVKDSIRRRFQNVMIGIQNRPADVRRREGQVGGAHRHINETIKITIGADGYIDALVQRCLRV